MKKIVMVFASICVGLLAVAQRPTATLAQVNDMVQNATLYVVLEESPINDYNASIRKAVEKNWTLTSFKFIHLSDLDSTKLQNPANAFLTPVTMQFGEDKDSVKYTFLSLLIGDNYETINDLPEVCTFPLCYESADEDEMTYKLPAIVAFFNKHVQNILSNPKLLKDKKYATYNKQKKNIYDKILYLIKYEQNPSFDEVSEIKSINPNVKVSVVESQSAVEKVLSTSQRKKSAGVLFLHCVWPSDNDMVQAGEMLPGRCYKVIMDMEGNLYYFSYHKMNGNASLSGMTAKDWKALVGFTK